MTDEIVASISARYKELYHQMTGEPLGSLDYSAMLSRIEQNIINSINSLNLQPIKKQ